MKCLCLIVFTSLSWLVSKSSALPEALIVYSFAPELPTSKAYQIAADGQPLTALQTKPGAILSFGMTSPITLKIAMDKQPKEVVVRPLSAGVKAEISENGFHLKLPRPMNLSVEVDGDLDDPLLVFANPKIEKPDRHDPKVKYYHAGQIYDVGSIELKDDEMLFLEGGAVVRGVVRARGARNVSVRGPGILDGSNRSHKINFLAMRECQQAVLENFILLDSLGWSIHLSGSWDVQMSNVRVVGWRENSDGLDIEYSSNIKVRGCFWRSNDDCIAVKAMYPPGVKDVPFEEMIDPEAFGRHKVQRVVGDSMGKIDISECILWNDSGGQGFEIGFELRIDEIRDIRFTNSDIIHVSGGGAFTIHNGDRAKIRDLHIENVRLENIERFIDFHVGLSIYSEDCPREFQRSNPDRKPPSSRPNYANSPWQWYIPEADQMARHEAYRGLVQGVVIKDVNLINLPTKGSILNGFSESHAISDIRFENVVINGKSVLSAADAQLSINDYVRALKFIGKPTKEK